MVASIKRVCSSIFLLFMAFVIHHHQLSNAYQFNVGGRAGWVVNPPEPYNTWAGRMRFQVNDTLLFKYNQGSNSVLEVNGNDYSQCNTNNPITKMEDGNSIFKFNRSGPFYFISGNKTLCDQGQKIIIVVLAIRNGPPPAPVAPVPAPTVAPVSPVPAPAPAVAPVSPVPAPAVAPVSPVPAPAVAPVSPVPAPAVAPASPPALAPGGVTPPAVPAPGGVTPPAVPAPGSPGTNSPPTPPSSGSPPGTTPGSVTPPASGNSSGASFTAASALMSAVTIVLCLTLSG